MNVLFSKTDALGDALLATGFCRHMIEATGCDHFFWIVRKDCACVADLWEGSRALTTDTSKPPREAAQEILQGLASLGRSPAPVFISTELDAYKPWPADRDLAATVTWWGDFLHELQPSLAIAGTCTLNWVDWFLTLASAAARRAAMQPGQTQERIPPVAHSFLAEHGRPTVFTDLAGALPYAHELDRYAALTAQLGWPSRDLSMRLRVTRAELPQPWRTKDAVVIAPGSGNVRRCWPPQAFAAVVTKLVEGGFVSAEKVVVISGPADSDGVADLAVCLGARNLKPTILPSGPGDLPRLANLLTHAALVLTNETFIAHLAAALGAPAVAVWGGGHWGRFLPRQGCVTVVHQPLACYYCDWNCIFDECRCISQVSVDTVYQAVCERLANRRMPVKLLAAPPMVSAEQIRERFHQLHRDSTITRLKAAGLQDWLDCETEAKMQVQVQAVEERQAKEQALAWAHAAEDAKVKAEQWARDEHAATQQAIKWADEERQAKERALAWARAAEDAKAKVEQWARAAEQEKAKAEQWARAAEQEKAKAEQWARAAEQEKAKAEQRARDEQAAAQQAQAQAAEEHQAREQALAAARAAEELKRKREEELQQAQAWIQARSTRKGAFVHFLKTLFGL